MNSFGFEVNWGIYNEAYELSEKFDSDTTKVSNPYPKNTNEYYSWNIGWNEYYNQEWDKEKIY